MHDGGQSYSVRYALDKTAPTTVSRVTELRVTEPAPRRRRAARVREHRWLERGTQMGEGSSSSIEVDVDDSRLCAFLDVSVVYVDRCGRPTHRHSSEVPELHLSLGNSRAIPGMRCKYFPPGPATDIFVLPLFLDAADVAPAPGESAAVDPGAAGHVAATYAKELGRRYLTPQVLRASADPRPLSALVGRTLPLAAANQDHHAPFVALSTELVLGALRELAAGSIVAARVGASAAAVADRIAKRHFVADRKRLTDDVAELLELGRRTGVFGEPERDSGKFKVSATEALRTALNDRALRGGDETGASGTTAAALAVDVAAALGADADDARHLRTVQAALEDGVVDGVFWLDLSTVPGGYVLTDRRWLSGEAIRMLEGRGGEIDAAAVVAVLPPIRRRKQATAAAAVFGDETEGDADEEEALAAAKAALAAAAGMGTLVATSGGQYKFASAEGSSGSLPAVEIRFVSRSAARKQSSALDAAAKAARQAAVASAAEATELHDGLEHLEAEASEWKSAVANAQRLVDDAVQRRDAVGAAIGEEYETISVARGRLKELRPLTELPSGSGDAAARLVAAAAGPAEEAQTESLHKLAGLVGKGIAESSARIETHKKEMAQLEAALAKRRATLANARAELRKRSVMVDTPHLRSYVAARCALRCCCCYYCYCYSYY